MNKFLVKQKVKAVSSLFTAGALMQLTDETTLGISTVVGIYQGLKYNGSLVRGIKSGVGVLGALSVVNGVRAVLKNMDYIKNA